MLLLLVWQVPCVVACLMSTHAGVSLPAICRLLQDIYSIYTHSLLQTFTDVLLVAADKGPIDNLFDHMANPGQVNFATNGVSLPFISR